MAKVAMDRSASTIRASSFRLFVVLGHETPGLDVSNRRQDLHGSKAIGRSGTVQKKIRIDGWKWDD